MGAGGPAGAGGQMGYAVPQGPMMGMGAGANPSHAGGGGMMTAGQAAAMMGSRGMGGLPMGAMGQSGVGPPQLIRRTSAGGNAFFGIKRLLEYGELLSPPPEQSKDIKHWRMFVKEFFADHGTMKYALWNCQSQWNPHHKEPHRTFDLNTALLPRFYQVNFQSGVSQIQLLMSNPREVVVQNGLLVECTKASIIYHYENGLQVVCNGLLRVHFAPNAKIELFEFHTKRHTQYIPRDSITFREELGSPMLDTKSEGGGSSSDQKPSRPGTPPNGVNIALAGDFLEPQVNDFGITIWVMRCLENRFKCMLKRSAKPVPECYSTEHHPVLAQDR
ncbi:hypothetical protein HK104_001794 [Borealophlyctis nickersoniae]|nr:hypothetical protein HK104_001794 [Borealophlyctis nickersoniae]